MTKFTQTAAQGEVNIRRIDALPTAKLVAVSAENGLLIAGHSESGHHHGFRDDGSVQLMERTTDVPAGMKILYAIVKNPTQMLQDAAHPHEPITVESGIYELQISREYNPFTEEARRVAD